jgi:hypothetical protein
VGRKVRKTHCSLENSDLKLRENKCGVRSMPASRAIKAIMEESACGRSVVEVQLAGLRRLFGRVSGMPLCGPGVFGGPVLA